MLTVLLATGIIGQGEAPPSDDFAAFIAVFPAFAGISEAAFAFWTGQAAITTQPLADCLGQRYQLATWLMTAHLLTVAGLGTGAEAQAAAQGMSGFTSIKSGSLSLERDSGASSMGEYGGSQYGRQVYPMLRGCLSGPRVTATGFVSGGYGGQLRPWGW